MNDERSKKSKKNEENEENSTEIQQKYFFEDSFFHKFFYLSVIKFEDK